MHLLTGYVYCADCDRKMYVFHKTQSPCYRCGKCSNHIMEKDLDEIYHGQLKRFLLTEVSPTEYLKMLDDEISEKQNRLSKISVERETLSKKANILIEMRMNAELSKEAFAERYRPMEEQLQQLADQMPALQGEIDHLKVQYNSSDIVLQNASNLYAEWEGMPWDEKRSIIETITSRITIGKQDIRITLSCLPTMPQTANPTQNEEDPTNNQNPVKRQSTHA
ncbi:MAG: recombinase zinc beta ribbon domain-containing protein [Chitinophagaceae bacterium]|nr:recombinase zinc beta ribbon domain-containing protein [Chitinophagaceae bacterium]